MRLVLSESKVNIFNLAKNAGTPVEQIERFYARNLPMSAEMARNLQSFGEEEWVKRDSNRIDFGRYRECSPTNTMAWSIAEANNA